MMTSQDVLSIYEAMGELTTQMLAAANAGDWDRLVALEQQCAAHVQALKANANVQALQGENRDKKVELIRKMLDDDRRIRDLTMPWMARLSALINNAGTSRRLSSAYGRS